MKKNVMMSCFIIFYLLNLNVEKGLNKWFILTNFIITFFSFYRIFFSRYNYSINKIKYIYCLIFLGFAPLIQFQKKSIFWRGTPILEETYVYLNILLIVGIFVYDIFYSIFIFRKNTKFENWVILRWKNKLDNKNIRIKVYFLVFFILLLRIKLSGSIENVFFRGGYVLNKINLTTLESSIYNYVIFIIPAVIYYYTDFSNKKRTEKYILFLFLFLINFPLKITRTLVAMLYIPKIMSCEYFNRKNKLSLVIVTSLFVIFPILDIFRRFNGVLEIDTLKLFNLDLLSTYHFDSYQIFIRVFEKNNITNGNQLLGVLLFFVPRGFWIEKPLESGVLTSIVSKLSFNMLSLNFYGEGYINFGFFGVLIFAIFKGVTNARLDYNYWRIKKMKQDKRNIYFKIFYLFLLGFEFFINRGPLMSSYSIFIGTVVAIIITKKIMES